MNGYWKGLFFVMSLLVSGLVAFAQEKPLRMVFKPRTDTYGYVDAKGDTVIPMGKYKICFTEKFDRTAFVVKDKEGIVGIDRKERVLFHVFVFDNGPDEVHDGLFRIVENGKIGYANMKGEIVIKPQYDGAFQFENGKAKVGIGCKTQSYGEHSGWIGGRWSTIDKKGNVVSRS